MTHSVKLISVDVGGTIGEADSPGLTMQLTAASPLPAAQARAVMRGRLHTQPAITDALAAELADALGIELADFPRDMKAAPLTLYPYALDALRQLAGIAPVVTLSNVTCVDADTENLRQRLAPWVTGLFSSCALGYAKPDPRAFLAVAEYHGVAPASMIHIGDDWACDVLGALDAGAIPVWISKDRPIPDTPPTRGRQHVHVAATLAAAAALIRTLNTPEGTTS
ncbi:HAD family hydrolase [Streptomyces antarcticus]|uniref:HAD family hydrolase n=1 Tax=Streptomyces antarcticus TaxID=2996458 RepID=UPI002270FD22|nr:HAD family hydrolase [Streptomyces sp. H34-AA3]MCY0945660.1 HAD family hydrolase [Streptomyces sp. H34-AA3]